MVISAYYLDYSATLSIPRCFSRFYSELPEAYANEYRFLNGEIALYPAYNTLQVNDYSKFNMGSFSEEKKKKSREKRFPVDMEKAYELGAKLSR